MSETYLPNAGAALDAAGFLQSVGNQTIGTVETYVSMIRNEPDPFGGDETGNALRDSIGPAQIEPVLQAMLGLGPAISGLGSFATNAIDRTRWIDNNQGDAMTDVRV